MDMEITKIFDKEKGALGELAFEHPSRFSGELVGRVRGNNENREHVADAPAATQFHDHRNCMSRGSALNIDSRCGKVKMGTVV